MRENRTRDRFDVSLTARLHGSSTQQEVRVSNLSVGGCYVDSIAEVFVGETILIRILSSEDAWLELQSVVAHSSSGPGFGVRFVDLDETLRRTILSLIQRANPHLERDPKGSWRLGEIGAVTPEVKNSGKLFSSPGQIDSTIN